MPSKSQAVYGISQECCTWFHLISGLIPLPLSLNHFFVFGSVYHTRQYGGIDHKNSQRMIKITKTNIIIETFMVYIGWPLLPPNHRLPLRQFVYNGFLDNSILCYGHSASSGEACFSLRLSFTKQQEMLCDLFNATCNRLGINSNIPKSAARCHKLLLAILNYVILSKTVIQNYLEWMNLLRKFV